MPARDESEARGVLERFDHAASRYESWYETRHGALAAEAERRLLGSLLAPETTSDRALEVGCGTGYFTEWLDTRYASVVGLDGAPEMLRELRRRHRRFPIVRGDAHRLPFADGAFRTLLFLTTLEFLDDPDEALREAVRVARSEIVILWLNPWSVGALKRRLARLPVVPGETTQPKASARDVDSFRGKTRTRNRVGKHAVSMASGTRGCESPPWRRARDQAISRVAGRPRWDRPGMTR
jgi:ubiquinone/menaquinone biosynthesis C-methylase UbiE